MKNISLEDSGYLKLPSMQSIIQMAWLKIRNKYSMKLVVADTPGTRLNSWTSRFSRWIFWGAELAVWKPNCIKCISINPVFLALFVLLPMHLHLPWNLAYAFVLININHLSQRHAKSVLFTSVFFCGMAKVSILTNYWMLSFLSQASHPMEF